jgi:tRNA (cmo5U34)-methyltransferase
MPDNSCGRAALRGAPDPVDAGADPGNAGVVSDDHFDPATYREWVRGEIPHYDQLQESIADATAAVDAVAILDLGTGTGETLAGVLHRHPLARAVGVDESEGMLAVARGRLEEYDVTLAVADLLDPLPAGRFDLVVSALAVHHLDGPGKATLFARVAEALRPGGRLVLGDVILPPDVSSAVIPLTDGWDKPSTVADQVGWMEDAGLVVTVLWEEGDLAIFSADRPPG